jgi:hypothetical protein
MQANKQVISPAQASKSQHCPQSWDSVLYARLAHHVARPKSCQQRTMTRHGTQPSLTGLDKQQRIQPDPRPCFPLPSLTSLAAPPSPPPFDFSVDPAVCTVVAPLAGCWVVAALVDDAGP